MQAQKIDSPALTELDKIPFNIPTLVGGETERIGQVFQQKRFSSNGPFALQCSTWFTERFGCSKALMMPSCTHGLEAAAILTNVGPEDEIILPSFAFTSTATAFARRGCKLVFVDIEPGTMNIDPDCVAAAVTERTKAIVVLHYAGVACDMDRLCAIAQDHGLWLVEDAAQALLCTYKGKLCGSFGDYASFSFHETKNLQSGEGGALLVWRPEDAARAEVVQEKGSNRSRFFRGEVDKYTWVGLGSSYMMSEIAAAMLSVQLEQAEAIMAKRHAIWELYNGLLAPVAEAGRVTLPVVPQHCVHNGHIFFLKADDEADRNKLIDHLKGHGIQAVFHYIPLHSSPAGKAFGRFFEKDAYTTKESGRLLRLPLYHEISEAAAVRVAEAVGEYYGVSISN